MIRATVYRHEVLGELTMASDGESIVGLWMEGQKRFGSKFPRPFERCDDLPVFARARVWLDRYFADDPLPVSVLPLAPRGTVFQNHVWRILAQIPYGELRTYGDIADQIACETGASHRSARAVGAANGRNPISIILPCHRVVGGNGSLAGYAGGIERKLWLLRHEGVDTSRLFPPRRDAV